MSETLATHWREYPLGELLASLDQGWSPKCLDTCSDDPGTWAVIKTTAIQPLSFRPEENKVLPDGLKPRSVLQISSGDILITRAGPRSRVGISCLVGNCRPRLLLCDKAYRLRVKSALADPSYIALILNSPEITEVIEAMKSGISDSGLNLTQDKFLSINIPTPPLAEQRRIVARIEALFARTRRARADLERVAPLASRYRRQALQHVFDDAASSFDAVRLGALLAAIEAGKNIRCEERRPHAGERGIVKISAVTWGRFDAEEIKTAPADAHLDSRTRIAEGDFLLSRANTLELVGAPVIADGVPPDTYLSDKVLRLRFHDRVEPWVMWFLRSPPGRSEIEGRSSGNQLSMRNIGQGALREIPVPLPGNPERVRLVSVIEQQHGAADRAEHEATRALALLDRLEQSILARAFRGELVPQDATNEPADVSVAHTSTADSPRSQPASRRGRGRPRKQRVS